MRKLKLPPIDQIRALRASGETYASIGKRFGASRQAVDIALRKAKDKIEAQSRGSLEAYLGSRSVEAIADVTNSFSPTVDMLRDFIQSNPNWRNLLLRRSHFGKKSLKEVEQFARRQGMLEIALK